MPVFYLSAKLALYIHEQVIKRFGNARGLRDEGALKSAMARPRTTFGGRPLYPTLFEKAAALLEWLCKNQPFIDGNKRVAYIMVGIFLEYNGWSIEAAQEEAIPFMEDVAAGKFGKEEIRIWLEERAKC